MAFRLNFRHCFFKKKCHFWLYFTSASLRREVAFLQENDGGRVRMFALIMPSAFVRSNKAKCIQSQATPPNYIEIFSLRLGHKTALALLKPFTTVFPLRYLSEGAFFPCQSLNLQTAPNPRSLRRWYSPREKSRDFGMTD